MSRFVKLVCGPESETLLSKYPNAFLLFCQIAMRAKWKDCPISGLKQGESWLGDWKAAGLKSKKTYEVAISRLATAGLVEFKRGNRGTVATITTSMVFDIAGDAKGKPEGTPTESQGVADGTPRETNKTERQKDGRQREEENEQPPALANDFTDTMPRNSAAELEALQKQINSLNPSWMKRPSFTRQELEELLANRRIMSEAPADDWKLLAAYLSARIDPDWPKPAFWQPDQRGLFIRQFSDVLSHADRWKRECIRRNDRTFNQALAS